MSHPLFKDQTLMRVKDILLILTAIVGIWAFFSGFISKSYGSQEQLNQLIRESDRHCKKYEPMTEAHEKAITILQEQNRMILVYLEKIERNVRK